jgi:hypothetical protein
MGYDMTAVTKDDGERERVAKAREVFNGACAARDKLPRGTDEYGAAQQEVDAAMEGMYAEERSYFRLNIWGMGTARDMMHRFGMLDVETNHPEWPDRKAFGVTDEQWDEYDSDLIDEATPQALRNFHAAHEAVVGHAPKEPTGICVFKLGSNDGWLVTPPEIEAALKTYYALDDVVRMNNRLYEITWWSKWIAYLEYCQTRGGFRVW